MEEETEKISTNQLAIKRERERERTKVFYLTLKFETFIISLIWAVLSTYLPALDTPEDISPNTYSC